MPGGSASSSAVARDTDETQPLLADPNMQTLPMDAESLAEETGSPKGEEGAKFEYFTADVKENTSEIPDESPEVWSGIENTFMFSFLQMNFKIELYDFMSSWLAEKMHT